MAKTKRKVIPKVELVKLDFGCGKNKRPDFTGLDIAKFDGVDKVLDVRKTPWPWKDNSVDEAYSSHFVEHLTGSERIGFFNELWRVMKVGATAQIVTPDWSNACAYGDPTHQWPPMSGWFAFYLGAWWRKENAPHVPYTCNFEFQNGVGWDPSIMARNDEFKQFAAAHYINGARDLYVNLVKHPMDWTPPGFKAA